MIIVFMLGFSEANSIMEKLGGKYIEVYLNGT